MRDLAGFEVGWRARSASLRRAGLVLALAGLSACGPGGVGRGTGGSGDTGGGGGQPVWPTDPADTPDAGEEPLPGDPPVAAPPPISGGTLAIVAAGKYAVAADPDRDRVFVTNLATMAVTEIALQPGDEPGRVAAGPGARAFVALRRGGAVISIDPAAGQVLERRSVCRLPRGLAWDEARRELVVACAEGQLLLLDDVSLAARGAVALERDLRDVVLDGKWAMVSRFRAAEVLLVDREAGTVVDRRRPPRFAHLSVKGGANFEAAVAWRMLPLASGGALLVHQRGQSDGLGAVPAGYYGQVPAPCDGGITHVTASIVRPQQAISVGAALPRALLPVDGALSADGRRVALVAAGNLPSAPRVLIADVATFAGGGGCVKPSTPQQPVGQPTSITFLPDGGVAVQTREPAGLFLVDSGRFVPFTAVSRADYGHSLFHRDSGTGIACASCHPEGGEDGRVWSLSHGKRRTQSIRGGVLQTAPFHWDGDIDNLSTLVHQVFVVRMGGKPLTALEVDQLARWLNTIPTLPPLPARDAAAAARGRALYESYEVGCITCHAGARLTNNATVAVGTGTPFQVPTLAGIGWRAPYMHDGCAPTLKARFGACGGGDKHGKTSTLSPAQIDDLVAYLETL